MHRIARLIAPASLLFLMALPGVAEAQWAWKDASGHLVFSDRPPPPGTSPSAIVRSPSGASSSATPDAPAPVAAPAPAAPAGKTALELETDFKKRQAERAAAEKKSSDAAAAVQAKAEDCARNRATVQQLQDGMRMRSADGGIMGDDERAAETARLQKQLGSVGC